MKINGKKIEGSMVEVILIPRGEGVDDIIFKAAAIMDFSAFDKLCPEPQPGKKKVPGGAIIENIEDPAYKEAVAEVNSLRLHWMVLESLKATEGLEWETVVMGDRDTWKNYETELKSSGFSQIEVGMIVTGVMTANALNEAKLTEARKSFLATTQAEQKE